MKAAHFARPPPPPFSFSSTFSRGHRFPPSESFASTAEPVFLIGAKIHHAHHKLQKNTREMPLSVLKSARAALLGEAQDASLSQLADLLGNDRILHVAGGGERAEKGKIDSAERRKTVLD